MDTKQGSYLEIAAQELAKWLCDDPDIYWTVDGDPILSGMLSLPCPGDELAEALRKVDKPLMILDRKECLQGRGEPVRASDLDSLVETEELDARVLQFCWKGSDIEWILIEDEETSESTSDEIQSSSSSSSFSSCRSAADSASESAPDETSSDGGAS